MTNSQRLAAVRNRLLQWLADEQREADADAETEIAILRESILVRDDFYCGRHFFTATHHAVWFIEEDELKIYKDSGELACVLSSSEIDEQPTVLKMPRPDDQRQIDEIRRAA